jgi:hypothetical protein
VTISFLEVPQGPADLIQGKHYRIRMAVEFEGTFKGVREDGKYVFRTKGKTNAGSGAATEDATRVVDPDLIVGIGTRKRTS